MATEKMLNSFDVQDSIAEDDIVLGYDKSENKVKNFKFGTGIWNWIVGKLATAVVSKLTTTDKTMIGAINELNSNKICIKQIYSEGIYDDCNDLPKGESATAFDSAKNRPLNDSTWYIFCMGTDSTKTQIGISANNPSMVLRRTYNKTWSDWE